MLQHCYAELEGKLKVMDTYYAIEMDQENIKLAMLIWNTYHLQDD